MRTNRVPLVAALGIASLLTPFATRTATAQVVTNSGGDVVMLSQKNVVDHLIVGDSIEVDMAQLASSRTQNTAVRDLASMLVTDHTAHLDNLRKLAGKSDIGREASSGDTSSTHLLRVLTQLKTMPADSGFDRAFVQAQIDHHRDAIASLKVMRSAAKDDDLQQDIDKTLPLLEQHLSRATQVAAQLAIPSIPADTTLKDVKIPVDTTPTGVKIPADTTPTAVKIPPTQ